MYGSTDIAIIETTTCPSAGSGCSTSTSRKSSGVGSPCGRAASCHSRADTVTDDLLAGGVPVILPRGGDGVQTRGCRCGLRSVHGVLPVQDAAGLGAGRAAR